MAIPEVKINIFKKTASEKSFIKLVKSKYNAFKLTLDPAFKRRRNKWVFTTQLSELKKLLAVAVAIEVMSAK